MMKKEMAILTASVLLNAAVNENNWKVKDLMKSSKADLESNMNVVNRILKMRSDNDKA